MSETPQTDERVINARECAEDLEVVAAGFARGLEREINQWKECAEKLAKCCYLQSKELDNELPPAAYEEWIMMVQEDKK